MKILIVEDNSNVLEILKLTLEKENFVIDYAVDGDEAFRMVQSEKYSVIILDIMLPGRSGFEIIGALRLMNDRTPILVISARDSLKDRVTALNLGADDYMVKDFAVQELVARIRSLIRRSNQITKNLFTCGDLMLNLSGMVVTRGGIPIHLTKKEFLILAELLRWKNEVVASQDLIRAVWGEDGLKNPNRLNVHIRALRGKIDDPFEKKLIRTVRGFGYKICCSEDDGSDRNSVYFCEGCKSMIER